MNWTTLIRDSRLLLPEIVLALAICAVLLAGMRSSFEGGRRLCAGIGLVGVAAACGWTLAALLHFSGAPLMLFSQCVVFDSLALAFKLIFLAGAGLGLLFALFSREIGDYRFSEFAALLMGAALGACLLASSNNLALFLLGFETLSLCCYVLAGFAKRDRRSAEAGLKYMLYGCVASGIMIFGFSWFYGIAGTLNIVRGMPEFGRQLSSGPGSAAALMALSLILAGLGFKLAMVPFHFWCPDAYQGSPTPVTAFLAVVSKAAGFAALLRLLVALPGAVPPVQFVFPHSGFETLRPLFGILAVVTMTLGNLIALRQSDVKRLLAYSAIAHAGYLLLGVAVLSAQAVEAMLAYLMVYLFMNFGAFWVVELLINRTGSSEISAYRGAASRSPFLFGALFVCLVALTGLPPTAGFAAKFLLFKVVVGAGIAGMQADGGLTAQAGFYFILALAGVLNSVVSLFYYMKIAKAMVFEEPAAEFSLSPTWGEAACAAALVMPVLLLLDFSPLLELLKGVGGGIAGI